MEEARCAIKGRAYKLRAAPRAIRFPSKCLFDAQHAFGSVEYCEIKLHSHLGAMLDEKSAPVPAR
jgi:hypothetical protein